MLNIFSSYSPRHIAFVYMFARSLFIFSCTTNFFGTYVYPSHDAKLSSMISLYVILHLHSLEVPLVSTYSTVRLLLAIPENDGCPFLLWLTCFACELRSFKISSLDLLTLGRGYFFSDQKLHNLIWNIGLAKFCLHVLKILHYWLQRFEI